MERFSERFEREARAVAALNHPNTCTLHDVISHAASRRTGGGLCTPRLRPRGRPRWPGNHLPGGIPRPELHLGGRCGRYWQGSLGQNIVASLSRASSRNYVRDLNFLAVSRDGSRFYIPQAVEQPASDVIHVRMGWIE
jgi:hypothetical protein